MGHLSSHMLTHLLVMNALVPMAVYALARHGLVPRIWRIWPWATAAQLALLWGWHSPAALTAAMQDAPLMLLMQTSLAGAAALFWMSIASMPQRESWRAPLALLITGKLFCLLGALLVFAPNLLFSGRTEGARPWLAASHGEVEGGLEDQHRKAKEEAAREHAELSLGRIIAWTIGLELVILVSGYLLARTGDALAEQTGLGDSAVGFVFLAFATSLPEFSTAITAAKSGLYTLAVSDIFGTNLINIGLIFVIDAVGTG